MNNHIDRITLSAIQKDALDAIRLGALYYSVISRAIDASPREASAALDHLVALRLVLRSGEAYTLVQ